MYSTCVSSKLCEFITPCSILFKLLFGQHIVCRWNLVCVDSHVTQITRTACHHHQQSISEAAILPMSQISTPQIATRESKVQVSYGTILHEEEDKPKRNM